MKIHLKTSTKIMTGLKDGDIALYIIFGDFELL